MRTVPPPAVPGDDRDWTFVITEGCGQCGFRPLEVTELAARFAEWAGRWREVLSRAGVGERPAPEVWSALEYACHVRDMLWVLAERLEAMLGRDHPDLADWDGDAKAVELRYGDADPAGVLQAIRGNANRVHALLDSVPADGWERTGRRSDGRTFTVAEMAQYIAHEMEHHLQDAGA